VPGGAASHVAAVVDLEHKGLAEILTELVLGTEAVDADHLHAFVDAVDLCCGHIDLAHRADEFVMLRMLVEVIGGSPGEIAGGPRDDDAIAVAPCDVAPLFPGHRHRWRDSVRRDRQS